MNRLIVRRQARSDIRAIRAWYEEERTGLGREFVLELGHVFERLLTLPLQFPEVWHGARRALLDRFPYAVYFFLRSEVISILAVIHQHREPVEWQRRILPESGGGSTER